MEGGGRRVEGGGWEMEGGGWTDGGGWRVERGGRGEEGGGWWVEGADGHGVGRGTTSAWLVCGHENRRRRLSSEKV